MEILDVTRVADLPKEVKETTYIRHFLNIQNVNRIYKLVQFYNNDDDLLFNIHVESRVVQNWIDKEFKVRYNLLLEGAFNTFRSPELLKAYREKHQDYVRLIGPWSKPYLSNMVSKKVNLYVKFLTYNDKAIFDNLLSILRYNGITVSNHFGMKFPIETPYLDHSNLEDILFRLQLTIREKMTGPDGKIIHEPFYHDLLIALHELYLYETNSSTRYVGSKHVVTVRLQFGTMEVRFTTGKSNGYSLVVTEN